MSSPNQAASDQPAPGSPALAPTDMAAASTEPEAAAAAPTEEARVAALIARMRAKANAHLDALRLLETTGDANLTDVEKGGVVAAIDESSDAFAHSFITSMVLNTPGTRRDELVRRIEADPDALTKDPQLAVRVDLELTKAERAETDPEAAALIDVDALLAARK